ncbi:glypican-5-like [Lineus longissimus]|uniref:glypican-5-like n=1 Tax=Lineus longissimus TaxID=88925 RepID=UPI002B4ED4B5
MLFKMGLMVFLVGVFAVHVSGLGTTSQPHHAPASNVKTTHRECRDVLQHFVKHKIGHRNLVPENKIHDPKMEVCYNGQTSTEQKSCCSHKMEKKYTSAAEMDFKDLVQTTSSYLKNLIATNQAQYEEEFLSMIRKAENSTDSLFDGNLYNIALKDRQPPLSSLFMDLQAYIKRKDVDIHDSVKTFFDDLFPLVFHSILNDPSATKLNDEYRECLMEVREQVYPHPFGEMPHNISRALNLAFTDARLFLEALGTAIEAINTTDHIILDSQCQKSLMRMKYCSHCNGYTTVRPCKNFCVNVMRGCLAKLQSLDTHWNKFVDAMQGMVNLMSGPNSIENVLTKLADNTSAAIMHAMVNTHKFYAKVKAKCGHLQTSQGHSIQQPVHRQVTPSYRVSSSSSLRLDQRISMFMRNLQSSKGFYHSLADTMCTNDQFAVQSHADTNCWNGQAIGHYRKNVTELTLEAQLNHNPEMHVSRKGDRTLVALQEKLTHTTKRLMKSKKQDNKQDDGTYVISFNYGESGDGSNQKKGRKDDGGKGDDEDYDYSGSGSGSGDGMYRMPNGGRGGTYPIDDNSENGFTIDDPKREYENRHTNSGKKPKSDSSKRDSAATTSHFNAMLLITSISIVLWLNG